MRILTAIILSVALVSGLPAYNNRGVNSPPADLQEAPLSEFEFKLNVALRGIEITKYNGTAEKVRIPETVEGSPVTGIGSSAFEGNSGITYVYIPDSVTSIGARAFMYCANLTDVIIPQNVVSIGQGAFCGVTGLTSVTIPGSVTNSGDNVFQDCKNLASVTILDGVTGIGVGTFSGCTNLASVTIPGSVTSIGGSAFRNCTALKSIALPDSVTSIGAWSRSSIDGLGYAVRDTGAFDGCETLTSATYRGKTYSVQRHSDRYMEWFDLPQEFYDAVNGY
ncbi:MAG: leucine-rich repeat domain-containing protein [Clostridia bacterium]|nr:leucine-rich repeat domain-containing protein [Clostridia bacterium]